MMTEKMLQVFCDYRDDYHMFLAIESTARRVALPTNQALATAVDFQRMWTAAYLEDMGG